MTDLGRFAVADDQLEDACEAGVRTAAVGGTAPNCASPRRSDSGLRGAQRRGVSAYDRSESDVRLLARSPKLRGNCQPGRHRFDAKWKTFPQLKLSRNGRKASQTWKPGIFRIPDLA